MNGPVVTPLFLPAYVNRHRAQPRRPRLRQIRCNPRPQAHATLSLAAVLVVLLLALLPGTTEVRAAEQPSILVLVSIDGYRADYINRGHSPVLKGLADEGVRATALRPVWPTLTYPNHYSLVTGLYPDHHGLVNNTMHDPELGDFSPANREANSDGRWWSGAEPVWVTAQKRGLRTASVFWPGTQAQIGGVRPDYWLPFDASVSPEARVAQILQWLDLPAGQRPRFLSLYFDQVDTAGHFYGPDAPQVLAALEAVDAALGQLLRGLRTRGLYESSDLVIVSDHGMRASSPQRTELLDDLVDPEHLELVSSLVATGINPKPGFESEVRKALLGRHAHYQCWNKADTPARFHYGRNARIPSVLCLAEPGWMLSTRSVESHRARPLLGEHGYDVTDPQMQALFVAHGPDFRSHAVVAPFDNIDVYALLCRLLQIKPLQNDGSARMMGAMLRQR
jgi:predicted AlkP superfamily pyrophosphatase or phosphodiesterase